MPRQATKLSKKDLDNLRTKAERDPTFTCTLADAGQPGLQVSARNGRVRFSFRYRPPGGGLRKTIPIDLYGAITLEEARDIAAAHRGQVAWRIDPAVAIAAEEAASTTVEQAVANYLAEYQRRIEEGGKGKPGGLAAARRLLEKNVLPHLGTLRLRDVTADHVKRMLRSKAGRPVEANRTVTALFAVFRSENTELPYDRKDRLKETGQRRDLSAVELMALGEALNAAEQAGKMNPGVLFAIRFLALTGFRRSELLGQTLKVRRGEHEGLRWADVDLDSGRVFLRDSKTGKQERVIGAAAVELLRAAKPQDAKPMDCVCPGETVSSPFTAIDKPRARLWAEAGIEGSPRGRADLHSLRHSFASVGSHVQNGRFASFIGPLLGHGFKQAKSVTMRYVHPNSDQLRPAADAIAAELARLIGLGSIATVIEFPRKEAR